MRRSFRGESEKGDKAIHTKIKVKRVTKLLLLAIAWTLMKKKERLDLSYLNLQ